MSTEDFEGSETIPWDATAVDAPHCTLFGLTERTPQERALMQTVDFGGQFGVAVASPFVTNAPLWWGLSVMGEAALWGLSRGNTGNLPSFLLFAVIKHQARVFQS